MADFTSIFWHWFIIIPVVLGIIGLFWLIIWMTEKKTAAAKKPQSMGHVWDEDLEELNNPLPRWWLNLFYITLFFGMIYLTLYPGMGKFAGLLGWTQVNQYQKEMAAADSRYGALYERYLNEDIRTLVHNRQAMKTGARLFATYCSTCHGSDARGAPGFPNLRDNDWLYGGDPKTIKASIMNGRGRRGSMPAWKNVLGKEGVFNVAEYVRSLSGHKVNVTAASLGEIRFKQLCVGCHGANAKGNQALGAPNLSDNIWLYGGTQKTVMETIAKGRGGVMPAHGEFLGQAKVHLLAAYIYSLSADNLKK